MKTKFTLPALRSLGLVVVLVSLATTRLAADVLAADTAVFVQADAKSHVLTRLKSGNTIVYTGDAPAGWRRVEISGTFEAFAHSRDITKGLEVKEGANIYSTPEKNSAVLTVAQKEDVTEVTGLKGDFCQIKLTKKLQGFIATGANANTPGTTSAATLQSISGPIAPPENPNAPGRPVAISGNTANLPRLFSGTFVSARRPLINPNPLYDYQLTDIEGRRFAFVDTKRLVLTEKIESYLGTVVVVSGTIRNTVDGKDLVVDAQSISRKK
jgi:hypothetical protein